MHTGFNSVYVPRATFYAQPVPPSLNAAGSMLGGAWERRPLVATATFARSLNHPAACHFQPPTTSDALLSRLALDAKSAILKATSLPRAKEVLPFTCYIALVILMSHVTKSPFYVS
jgi:hypothetical protein